MSKPQILACNHPSGFIEPLILACFSPKPLHFLVRGDVFEKKWLAPLLYATNQIPIFRFKDGFSKLRNNAQSFDKAVEVLANGGNLLIFVEGNTQSIKQLRPLQKGLARLVIQTNDAAPEADLEIVPIGINFTYQSVHTSDIYVSIGPPISTRKTIDIAQKSHINSIDSITQVTYSAMMPLVIHIENTKRIPLFEKIVQISRPLFQSIDLRRSESNTSILDKERNIAQYVNHLDEKKYNEIIQSVNAIANKPTRIFKKHPTIEKQSPHIFAFFVLILGILPAAIGWLFHLVPRLVATSFVHLKVKQIEFKTSIDLVVTILFLPIYYLILLSICSIYFSTAWIIVFLCAGAFYNYYNAYLSYFYWGLDGKKRQKYIAKIQKTFIS